MIIRTANAVMKQLQVTAMSNAPRSAGRIVLMLAVVVGGRSTAQAQGSLDRVVQLNGMDSGKVASTSVLGVVLERGGVDKKIPAEQIVSVYYAGEPSQLNAARLAIDSGRYQEAIELLEQVSSDELDRELVETEHQFLTTLAVARQSLARSSDLERAVEDVKGFLTANRSSFHVPAAIELLGDLYVALQQYDQARTQYAKLSKAPSAYYKLKSAILTGRALQAAGNHEEALAQFEEVLQSSETGPAIEPIRLAATMESAVSRAATGGGGQAAAAIHQIIAAADPEDADLLARAYNALGEAELTAGNPQAALFAFLHVDLLYSSASAEHAQALKRLAELWKELGHPDRAEDAAQRLSENYPTN